MPIVNLVYKIKKAKNKISGVVDRLKMANKINIKRFLKSLPSSKYVTPPLHSYYLKSGE